MTHFPILNTPALRTDFSTFPQAFSLERRLRDTIKGEVRFDDTTRALYATDASNYRQIPIGVVSPLNASDVEAALRACREFDAPVLSRGGGTSLAGQCCNTAVVLDFSRWMSNVLMIDPQQKTALVEPGVVLDRVREAAEAFELTFAPDPATHNRCTLGGMIGNNSCGTHSLLGGKTVDNIESMEVLLYDGVRMHVGPTSEDQLNQIIAGGGRKGEIYLGLKTLRDEYVPLIRERFPRIPRRVSGYNLDELLPENGFNVARALVGSEGTCITVLEATLRLVESPQFRTVVGLGFPDAFVAADAVPLILNLQHSGLTPRPIALEGIDNLLLDYMRRKHLATEEVKVLPQGNCILLVEYGAGSEEASLAQAHALAAAATAFEHRPAVKIFSRAEARQAWFVRESALGATAFSPGQPSGWEGWEDAAVAPEKLGTYLRSLFKLMAGYGYTSPLYGHFGHGCVHLRINFDFHSETGIAKFRSFIDRAADLVVSLGGSISGEHGDGQARGALLEKMFGPELMQAFQRFKALWDPHNRMNPGKLINAYQPQDYLRENIGHHPMQTATYFAFRKDDGSLEHASARCVGVGACRKEDAGTMCPSYMVTREEKHSTRGRAHLLWEMMQGDIVKGGWNNEGVHEALDLCLSCKACKTECPVGVDMATYKAEFLAHHYAEKPRPIAAYAFGYIDRLAQLASIAPGFVNAVNRSASISRLLKQVLHMHPARSIPAFAAKTYRQQAPLLPQPDKSIGDVLLWADTFNNYFRTEAAVAAHKVLATAGFRVHTLKKHLCCGRPLYDFGLLDSAKQYLLSTLDAVQPHLQAGMPVVVLEPSCASVFRDELNNLLPDDPRALELSANTFLLSEFLVHKALHYIPPTRNLRFLVQGHCHHQALMKMTDEMAILSATRANVQWLDAGCCGMAGPFGFDKDKFAISQSLAERRLLPAVRRAAEDTIIIADGFSCREQIAQNSSRRAVHLAEVLSES